MIIVTGGAGFIGSNVVAKLNEMAVSDILIVDNLGNGEKWKNLRGKYFKDFINKTEFLKILPSLSDIDAIIHMGACSSTIEKDADYLMENNFKFSKFILDFCVKKNIKLIYASSAATYGDGSFGYSDSNETTFKLKPLNMYGFSKQLLDLYFLKYHFNAKNIVGLKFFNVFGPNEYHKKNMKSMVAKAFEQIKEKGYVNLFKSYKTNYENGKQKRDFIYVKDVSDIIWWFLNNSLTGIYNVGSGVASTWLELIIPVFNAMNKTPDIRFVEMPLEIKDKYQYYTKAEIQKLRDAGYSKKITPLKDAVTDYVKNYLMKDDQYL